MTCYGEIAKQKKKNHNVWDESLWYDQIIEYLEPFVSPSVFNRTVGRRKEHYVRLRWDFSYAQFDFSYNRFDIWFEMFEIELPLVGVGRLRLDIFLRLTMTLYSISTYFNLSVSLFSTSRVFILIYKPLRKSLKLPLFRVSIQCLYKTQLEGCFTYLT